MFGLKSDGLLDAADVQASPRLSVRFGAVPCDAALVTDLGGDQGRKALDADLLAGSQIEGARVVVLLSGENDAFRCILDVQKFPRRSPSPQRTISDVAVLCFRNFLIKAGITCDV